MELRVSKTRDAPPKRLQRGSLRVDEVVIFLRLQERDWLHARHGQQEAEHVEQKNSKFAAHRVPTHLTCRTTVVEPETCLSADIFTTF